jgi:hypothetical protein
MDSVSFSAHQLIVGAGFPSFNLVETALSGMPEHFELADYHYEIEAYKSEKRGFIWLYATFGKAFPHAEYVYNVNINAMEDNPRKSIQVEQNRQLFCMIDFVNEIVYLSSQKKRSVFEAYFSKKIGDDVTIKNFYMNAQEFLGIIKRVGAVKLVSRANLFTQSTDIFTETKNAFGLGTPEDVTLEVKFDKANKTGEFIEKFLSWSRKRELAEIDGLVCIGFDDSDMETIYNTDSFMRKIEISAKMDVNGFYDPDGVRNGMISFIRPKNV